VQRGTIARAAFVNLSGVSPGVLLRQDPEEILNVLGGIEAFTVTSITSSFFA
jgi:hypothetical protein